MTFIPKVGQVIRRNSLEANVAGFAAIDDHAVYQITDIQGTSETGQSIDITLLSDSYGNQWGTGNANGNLIVAYFDLLGEFEPAQVLLDRIIATHPDMEFALTYTPGHKSAQGVPFYHVNFPLQLGLTSGPTPQSVLHRALKRRSDYGWNYFLGGF